MSEDESAALFGEFREETGRARETDTDRLFLEFQEQTERARGSKAASARCDAIAESTGEQCEHDAVDPFPYCGLHMDLLDEIDLRRMGLKLPKSDG